MKHKQVLKVVGFFRNSKGTSLREHFNSGVTRSPVRINRALLLFLIVMQMFLLSETASSQAAPVDHDNVGFGTLRVLSLHRMTESEIKAHPDDYLDARIVLVLRYESPKDRSVYIYAPPKCPPEGYLIERTDGKVVWFESRVNGKEGSPGFLKLQREIGKGWIYLPPSSAIEWQTRTVDPAPGSENAWSVFVKGPHEALPHEVPSDWFKTSDLK